jgi:hypothetical protein
MSVRPHLYVQDPRLEFVSWLQLRTEEGNARWNRQKNVIEMNLAGSTQMEFVTYQNTNGVEAWELFTVRDSQGRELIRATPPRGIPNGSPLPLSLDMAADALFVAITNYEGCGPLPSPAF